ncbi:MAG: autotransporter domain-containing protein [Pseudomonadota bacterium]
MAASVSLNTIIACLTGTLVQLSTIEAHAQTVVPPTAGPCVVSGTTATCTGNVSTGVDADGPTINTLTLNGLTQNITPAVGVDAINFSATNADATVNLELGGSQIIVPAGGSQDAIEAFVNGNGNATINSTGNLTINGTGNGISGTVTGNGAVVIGSTGNISTQGFRGIVGQVFNNGSVSINSTGNVAVNAPTFPGFPAFPTSAFGILGGVTNAGDIQITSNGDVTVTGAAFASGIQVNNFIGAVVPRTATVVSTGNITVTSGLGSDGINAGHDTGSISITSTGNISADRGITATAGVSGDITVVSTGSIAGQIHGISASTASGVANITVDGGLVSGTDGIVVNAVSATPSTIRIDTGGAVQSIGTTATDRAIDITGGPANITVAGSVTGGTGGAIQFAPGNFADQLELQPGFNVAGTVFADAGTDTLRFAGTGAGAFDVSLIDTGTNTQQFRQFETFEVNGGTWTFSNATNASFIGNGGTITGSATFGGLTMNSGSILAPGADLGTMSVSGNVAFNAGSTLQADLRPDGTSDLLSVTGATTISSSGTVLNAVVDPAIVPANPTTWTVINSTGGVTGQFANVTDNLPDVDLQAVYNPNSVQLVYTPATDGNFSYKEIHPSATMAALDSSLLFVETLRRHGALKIADSRDLTPLAREARFASDNGQRRGQGTRGHRAGHNGGLETLTLQDGSWSTWAGPIASYTDVEASSGTPGWDATRTGFAFGLEHQGRIEQDIAFTAGLALGYISTSVNSAASTADIDGYHVGLHAAAELERLSVSGAVAYAYQDFDYDRVVPIGANTLVTDGSAGGHSVSASFEGFYDVAPPDWQGVLIGPLATVGAAHGNRGAFSEAGAGALNLDVQSDTVSQVVTGLGAAVGVSQTFGGIAARLDARLQWEHVFGDTSTTTASTLSAVNSGFRTSSAQGDRDRLGIGLGAAIDFSETVSAHIRYDGSIGPSVRSHDASIGMTIKF